jgi:hypothetical protein
MAHHKTMRSFLPAMALCAVLQPALAGNSAPARPASPAPAPVMLHAAITPATAVPVAATAGTPVVVAGFKGEASLGPAAGPKAPQPDEGRPTTVAVLLTALAVMTGIALRRWGTDES